MKITSHKPGRASIDPADETIVRRWAKNLGKTSEEIFGAIEKVGNNADSIKRELGCDAAGGEIAAPQIRQNRLVPVPGDAE